MGAPAYVIYACLLLLMAAALTLGDRTVYNIDSKQFYCDKSEFNCERGVAYENDNNKNESKE